VSKIASTPECQKVRRWIIAQEGRTVFAPFTSQDSAAFSVFVHAMELWCHSDATGNEAACAIMREALRAMQPKLRHLCKLVIPAVGDWGHVDEIWPQLEAGE
jgi:hypothetical protein